MTNWGNSAAEVDKNLDQMKQHANLKLGEMQKTVDSHFSGQYNTMTNKWKWAGERIAQIISEMIRNTERSLEGLAREMKSIGTRMGNNTRLANKMAGINKRDEATVMQLNNLSLMENIILHEVDLGIMQGKHYQEIYRACKKRLEAVKDLAYLEAV